MPQGETWGNQTQYVGHKQGHRASGMERRCEILLVSASENTVCRGLNTQRGSREYAVRQLRQHRQPSPIRTSYTRRTLVSTSLRSSARRPRLSAAKPLHRNSLRSSASTSPGQARWGGCMPSMNSYFRIRIGFGSKRTYRERRR